jgi:serine/threonine-protein kinase
VQVTTVDTARGEQDHFWPSALPKGRGVLFTIQRTGNSDKSDVAVLDTKSMTYRVLVQGLTARYAPSGHLLYVTAAGDMMAVPFDLGRLELGGEPFSLSSGIARRPFGAVDFTVSESGTLLYLASAGETAPGEIVYVSRDGAMTPIDSGLTGDFHSLALSPDGRRLAASKVEGTEQQVWVKQLPDGPLTKLTFEGNRSVRPVWSPDGNYVGYLGNEGSGQQLYRMRADGSSPPELVVAYLGRQINEAFWSRDGRWIVFRTVPNDIFAQRTAGDTSTIPILQSAFDEFTPALSPDGRWLAYMSNESGTFEVFVRPFPAAQSAKWQVSTASGSNPFWSPDGRELLYWTLGAQLVSVPVLPGTRFVAGQSRTLPIDGQRFVGEIGAWDITPDGKRFIGIRAGSGGTEQRELIVVENLSAELSAPRAP